MIELNIPGRGLIQLEHLVCDVNGTLTLDGRLLDGMARLLGSLSDRLELHLLTADTHGRQDEIDRQLNLTAVRIESGAESEQKAAYVKRLGADRVIAIGQGTNDAAMLRVARLGICILSREGAAIETLQAADVLVPDIITAIELIDRPLRLVATLRK